MFEEIISYLKQHHHACLKDIAGHLDADPGAVEPMLAFLEARGRILKIGSETTSACGGCSKCLPRSLVLWTLAPASQQ